MHDWLCFCPNARHDGWPIPPSCGSSGTTWCHTQTELIRCVKGRLPCLIMDDVDCFLCRGMLKMQVCGGGVVIWGSCRCSVEQSGCRAASFPRVRLLHRTAYITFLRLCRVVFVLVFPEHWCVWSAQLCLENPLSHGVSFKPLPEGTFSRFHV